MRDVNATSITDAFLATQGKDTDARLSEVLSSLSRHLHDFARETRLTHAEWRSALQFARDCGRITTDERDEFVLLSDVLGLSSLVDMLHSPADGTPSSVLGPFHIRGAPELPVGGDLQRDIPGETVVVSGVVRGLDLAPIEGARIEVWQTAPNGLYSNQDEAMDPMALRARLLSDSAGRYAFTTVRPAPYTVPTDGPVGRLLGGMGRHPWRPAHFHIIAEAVGHRALVTELFPNDDPWLDQDAVFGVRPALCVALNRHESIADWPMSLSRSPSAPFFTVDFDIILVPDHA